MESSPSTKNRKAAPVESLFVKKIAWAAPIKPASGFYVVKIRGVQS